MTSENTKQVVSGFIKICETGNYKIAVNYLRTYTEFPATIIDYVRDLGNPELYKEVGLFLLSNYDASTMDKSVLNAAQDFLAPTAEDGDFVACQALVMFYTNHRKSTPDIRKAVRYCQLCLNSDDSLKEHILSFLFGFITTSKNRTDIDYVMDIVIHHAKRAIKPWNELLRRLAIWYFEHPGTYNIFNISDKDILNLPVYGLDENGCIKMDRSKWLSPCYLLKALDNETVFDYVLQAAMQGDGNCAAALVKPCFEAKKYDIVMDIRRHLNKCTYSCTDAIRILAEMYEKGLGVERNMKKALRIYHECVKDEFTATNVDYYNLGRIYQKIYEEQGKMADLKKARKYYKSIISPYHYDNCNDEYVKKAQKAFWESYRSNSSDMLELTVEVEKNLTCMFELRVHEYTCLKINWGESDKEELMPIYQSTLDRMTGLSHTYTEKGIYRISISTEGAYSIEGFFFGSKSKEQLLSVDVSRCPALKVFVATRQLLKELDFSRNRYLHGVICRDNRLECLDLVSCPTIMHMDCSRNPLKELRWDESSALTVLSCSGTELSTNTIEDIVSRLLANNRGRLQDSIFHTELSKHHMRLEYYVRCSSWEKLVPFLKKALKRYGKEEKIEDCRQIFSLLKSFKVKDYHSPYKWILNVNDTYISVEDMETGFSDGEEDFLSNEPWRICMATPVRYYRYREPWMRFEPIKPEYFVANCLVNMMWNKDGKTIF